MRGYHLLIVCAVAGWLGVSAEVSEAALAKLAGGSGLSGQLSSNKAIRKQQLIADPNEPDSGSTSVTYDTSTVHLSAVMSGPGYMGSAFVEVRNSMGVTQLQDFLSFQVSPKGIETGYVQFAYGSVAGVIHGQIAVPAGYKTVDKKGPPGVDTHAFIFDYLSSVPDSKVAVYRVYADPGNRPSGNTPDSMNGFDQQQGFFRIEAKDITGVTVQGNLGASAVPLPPAAYAGGMLLVGMAGFQFIRRRQLAVAVR